MVSSCAPEAPGTVEPSEWGPALRPLWASDQLDASRHRPRRRAHRRPGLRHRPPAPRGGCAAVVVGARPERPAARTVFERTPDHAPRRRYTRTAPPLVVARRPRARRPGVRAGPGGPEAAAELRQGRGRQHPDRRGRAVGVAPARRRGRGPDGGVRAARARAARGRGPRGAGRGEQRPGAPPPQKAGNRGEGQRSGSLHRATSRRATPAFAGNAAIPIYGRAASSSSCSSSPRLLTGRV